MEDSQGLPGFHSRFHHLCSLSVSVSPLWDRETCLLCTVIALAIESICILVSGFGVVGFDILGGESPCLVSHINAVQVPLGPRYFRNVFISFFAMQCFLFAHYLASTLSP